MPSGWEVYYVVFLSALLALGIPAVLWGLSRLFSKLAHADLASRPQVERAGDLLPHSDKSPFSMGRRINARFFVAANAALLLLAMALVLIPCTGTIQKGENAETVLRGLAAIVSVGGFAALGLLYSARKGHLSWLRSYQRIERKAEPRYGEDPA